MTKSQPARTIIHVTDSFFPESGGVERVVENLVLCQNEMGNKVVVMTKGLPNFPDVETFKGIKVCRYRHLNRPTVGNYLSTYFGSTGCLKEIIDKNKPDILHCHLTLSSQGPISLARKLGIPIVSSFYGPWDMEYLEESKSLLKTAGYLTGTHLNFLMKLQRWMQTRLIKNSKRIIVLSDYSRSHVERLSPDSGNKVVKIPGGLETKRFKPGKNSGLFRKRCNIPNSKFLILTVRRLVHRMGVDILLDAFKLLLQDRNDVVLIIGGKGPLEEALREKAEKLEISNNVFFAGFIPEEQLADAYREADIFILPSIAEENFGLPILEAAACGTPVLGTAVGSIPELLGKVKKDLLISRADPSAIAEKIDYALRNISKLEVEFVQIAKDIRYDYAWEKITNRIGRIYEEYI